MTDTRNLKIKVNLDDAQAKQSLAGLEKTGTHVGDQIAAGFFKAEIALRALGRAWEVTRQFALDSIRDGIKYNESLNLISVSLGKLEKDTRRWAESTSAALVTNKTEVLENVSTYYRMIQATGLASDEAMKLARSFTELTADFSSFYNIAPDEAFLKLRSAISGEFEPLKQLGILLNETTLKQAAYRDGIAKVGGTLTFAQKAQAAHNEIMRQAAAAIGDVERTSDGMANTLRNVNARWEEFRQILGSEIAGSPHLAGALNTVAAALAGINTSLSNSEAAYIWGKELARGVLIASEAITTLLLGLESIKQASKTQVSIGGLGEGPFSKYLPVMRFKFAGLSDTQLALGEAMYKFQQQLGAMNYEPHGPFYNAPGGGGGGGNIGAGIGGGGGKTKTAKWKSPWGWGGDMTFGAQGLAPESFFHNPWKWYGYGGFYDPSTFAIGGTGGIPVAPGAMAGMVPGGGRFGLTAYGAAQKAWLRADKSYWAGLSSIYSGQAGGYNPDTFQITPARPARFLGMEYGDLRQLGAQALGAGIGGGGVGGFLGTGIGGLLAGAIGGPFGALLGGLGGGFISKLFGGGRKKERGTTPQQPIYTKDVELQDTMTSLLNITKQNLIGQASAGVNRLANMRLNMQTTGL